MLTNGADTTEMKVGRFADGGDLLSEREIMVKIDSKIASKGRDRYFRTVQSDRLRKRVAVVTVLSIVAGSGDLIDDTRCVLWA